MEKRAVSTLLSALAVLALGSLACSSPAKMGGTGGEEETGGSGDTGGKGGSTTGGKSGTGGSTGGSTGTGGSGTGGSTGGSGGSTGGSGGNTGGSGGSTGGSGGGGTGGGGMGGATGGAGGAAGPIKLMVTGALMQNGKFYFKKGQTRDSGHMSPAMEWTPVADAKSYAVSLLDTVGGTHWVLYDIPTNITKLPDNLMRGMQNAPEVMGAKHTRFSGGNPYGYFGPGAGCRTYQFHAYALKVPTLEGVATQSPAAIRMGALASMTNLIERSAPVAVIGQASGEMCP